jgi:8-oxo-dGTP diphosphatase
LPPTADPARLALGVDCVVFGFDLAEADLEVLLIKRDADPFRGEWALPGGLVRLGETVDDAARRALTEETGLDKVWLEQLYTFGELGRDPRGRVVTVAHWALVKLSDHKVRAATDASEAAWFTVEKVPKLAFDHHRILWAAVKRLQGKVRWQPIGFELLPPKFTLTQLQRLYEAALERPLDKRNFRKKVLSLGLLEDSGEVEAGVSHRAARLYRFDRVKYRALEREGFLFEL